MKPKQWMFVQSFIFVSLYIYPSLGINWLCNQSLWTSRSPDDAWVFQSDRESNITGSQNCSVASSSKYESSFLWIGSRYNESLIWRNYRITVLMELLNGINAGIVVRSSEPTCAGWMGVGKSYLVAIYRSSLVIWKTYPSAKSEPVVSIHHQHFDGDYFQNRVLNITLDLFENRMIVYLDAQLIVEYTDNCDADLFLTGSIGIKSYSSTSRFTYLGVELTPSHIASQTYTILDENEQYALKQIYNSTGGAYWYSPWNLSQIESADACNSLCGIVCHTENELSHIMALPLANNNLSGTIPSDAQYLTNLQSIDLSSNHLYGSIPDIFGSLKHLNALDLRYNSLSSTIPYSMKHATEMQMLLLAHNNLTGNIDVLSNCTNSRYMYLEHNAFSGSLSHAFCNLFSLRILDISDNDLNDSLPDCFGQLRLRELYMSRNSITVNLTQNICPLSELRKIHLNSMQLVGRIPPCTSNLTRLFDFRMMDNMLSSSIPSEICKLKNLTHIMLSNNSLSGSIPSCIWTKLINLQQFYLNNNSLTAINITAYPLNIQTIAISDNKLRGYLAPFDARLTALEKILYHNNKLDTDLEKLFQNYTFFNNLTSITLHDNNFIHQNITELFSYWLYNLTKIKILSFANNKGIYGWFPEPSQAFKQQTLTHLVLHGNQLFGSLPTNVQFHQLEAFSLFNNIFSCTIPSCLIPTNFTRDHALKLMVIPSNYFILNADDTPWMDSSFFTTSHALFNSKWDIIKSYAIGTAAVISTAILIIMWINNYFFHRGCLTYEKDDLKSHFDKTIMRIIHNTGQTNIIAVVILVVIYAANCNFFACVLFADQLSFAFYYADPDVNGVVWSVLVDSAVCLLWIALSWSLCNSIYKTREISQKSQESFKRFRKYASVVGRDCKRISAFLLWLFLYLYLVFWVGIYIISTSLPSDDIPYISPANFHLLQMSMSFILTICNSLVVPKLVSVSYRLMYQNDPQQSIKFMSTYRPRIIFHLRSFTAVTLPCILSFWLLHDCGRGWTTFWSKCGMEHSELNIKTTIALQIERSNGITGDNRTHAIAINLLKSDDICSAFAFGNINWNKCLRQFSATWITILIQKVIIMHFMPIVVVGFKLLRWRVGKRLTMMKEKVVIEIDKEYAMILSKLEIMILYSWIFPLLIPLTITSISFNICFYEFIISERGKSLCGVEWILKPHRKIPDFSLNVNLLWMSVLFAQLLMTVFASFILYSQIFCFCLANIWIIMDSIFILKYYHVFAQPIKDVDGFSYIAMVE
eukprot:752251_1